MYPGGLKETPYEDMMRKKPEEVRMSAALFCSLAEGGQTKIIRHAVSGMLPKNKLRDRRLERLRIFPGNETGILGANVMRSWHDGTLPQDWDPTKLVKESQRILPAKLQDKTKHMTVS